MSYLLCPLNDKISKIQIYFRNEKYLNRKTLNLNVLQSTLLTQIQISQQYNNHLYLNIKSYLPKLSKGMKFFLVFTKKCVPQWKQCYYDYANMKSLIMLCKKAYAIRCNIEDLAREDNYYLDETENLAQKKQILELIKINKCERIDAMMVEANILFYKYHSISKRVVFLFCQYKIHQLNARLTRYSAWEPLVKDHKKSLTQLLSNCYAQNIKLQNMTQLHLQAYQKIHKKHERAFKMFGLQTPGKRTARLQRTLLDLDRYTQKLEYTLDSHQQIIRRETKYKLEQEVQPSPFRVSMMSYLFGLFNGFSICVIVAAIILLGVDIGINRPDDLDLRAKKLMFENQYRLWKGTGCIIMYIWIFALSYTIYEKKGINYNLIFNHKSKSLKSTESLAVATFLTLLWSTFFIFYSMDLVGIYKVATVAQNPRVPISIFFPVIILNIFVLLVAIQFVRTRRGVLYFALTIVKVLLSPFGFYQMIFSIIWTTQQLLSLVIILYDVAYTLCYYIKLLRTPTVTNANNTCFSFIIMVEIMCMVVFIIRFLQSVRMGIERKQFWLSREMFRAGRAILNIIVVALSMASSKSTQNNNYVLLWFWVVFAIICGIYSWVIDFVLDWNLFFIERDRNGKLTLIRREQNILSTRTINFMVGFDLFARWSFCILVCPKIVFDLVGYPELVMAIAQALQMCRRLVWNLLRVENQQVKNNYFFQIRTNYQTNQGKIIKQFEQNNVKYEAAPEIQNERTAVQIQTLRDYIRQKNRMKEKIIEFYQKNDEILQKLEEEAQEEIVKVVGQIV